MKLRHVQALCAVIAIAALAVAGALHAVETHEHPVGGKLALNAGKKWATDEPLRRGMDTIRADLAPRLAGIHKGKLSADEYRALGGDIEKQVGTIVAECKLEPKADAMLHLIIADLAAGSDAMQGKGKVAAADGARQAVHAVNAYGQYFDHPGWKPLR